MQDECELVDPDNEPKHGLPDRPGDRPTLRVYKMADESIMASSPDSTDSDLTTAISEADSVIFRKMPADVQAILKGLRANRWQ